MPHIEGNPSGQYYATMTRGGNARRTESAFKEKMGERLSMCEWNEELKMEITIFATWTGDEAKGRSKVSLADSIPMKQVTLEEKLLKFAIKSSSNKSVLTTNIDVADILRQQVSSQTDETEPVLLQLQRKNGGWGGDRQDCSARLKVTFSFDFAAPEEEEEEDTASSPSLFSPFSGAGTPQEEKEPGEAVLTRSPRGRSVWEYECEAKDMLIETLQGDITRLRTETEEGDLLWCKDEEIADLKVESIRMQRDVRRIEAERDAVVRQCQMRSKQEAGARSDEVEGLQMRATMLEDALASRNGREEAEGCARCQVLQSSLAEARDEIGGLRTANSSLKTALDIARPEVDLRDSLRSSMDRWGERQSSEEEAKDQVIETLKLQLMEAYDKIADLEAESKAVRGLDWGGGLPIEGDEADGMDQGGLVEENERLRAAVKVLEDSLEAGRGRGDSLTGLHLREKSAQLMAGLSPCGGSQKGPHAAVAPR